MNTTKPPFDDVKVRQAVNYAVDRAALERIYAGSLSASHQILPEGMPGHEAFNLYPHDMAKAKKLFAEANPSDRNITVWTDNESPNDEAGAYYSGRAQRTRLRRQAEDDQRRQLLRRDRQRSRPRTSTRAGPTGYQDYPHPNDFFQPLLDGRKHRPDLQHQRRPDRTTRS